jgi:hypothetical protein
MLSSHLDLAQENGWLGALIAKCPYRRRDSRHSLSPGSAFANEDERRPERWMFLVLLARPPQPLWLPGARERELPRACRLDRALELVAVAFRGCRSAALEQSKTGL